MKFVVAGRCFTVLCTVLLAIWCFGHGCQSDRLANCGCCSGTIPWDGKGERRTLFCEAVAPPFAVCCGRRRLLFADLNIRVLVLHAVLPDLFVARGADKYVPYGMHHGDSGYDVHDPELTERQRSIGTSYPSHNFQPLPTACIEALSTLTGVIKR